MTAFRPRSTSAQTAERDLEFRVRQLLVTVCGVHDPHVVLVEQEAERIVALFTVETLTGRAARTAFIEPVEPDGDPEVVVTHGFTF